MKKLFTIVILCFIIGCHFVGPEECRKMCKQKGVEAHYNIAVGLIVNACICKKKEYKVKFELKQVENGY